MNELENAKKEQIAKNIKHLREQLGWSQVYLAKKAGIPASSVCHFEAGSRKPAIETIIQIANAFDVSLDILVFGNSIHDINELDQYANIEVDKKALEESLKDRNFFLGIGIINDKEAILKMNKCLQEAEKNITRIPFEAPFVTEERIRNEAIRIYNMLNSQQTN